MSIKVYIKDKVLYDFKDEDSAATWIEKNPDVYEGNLSKIQLYSDKPMEDLILAIPETEHSFDCEGCGVTIKFLRNASETHFKVKCPRCGTIHGVRMRENS